MLGSCNCVTDESERGRDARIDCVTLRTAKECATVSKSLLAWSLLVMSCLLYMSCNFFDLTCERVEDSVLREYRGREREREMVAVLSAYSVNWNSPCIDHRIAC